MDQSTLKIELDKCVKCGLCLSVCPTFQLTQLEHESPRGRISLMQGYHEGHLSPTEPFMASLDHCVRCRACEKMCPSQVPYSALLENTYKILSNDTRLKKRSSWIQRCFKRWKSRCQWWFRRK